MNIKDNVSSVVSCHHSPLGEAALMIEDFWALRPGTMRASPAPPASSSVLLHGSSSKTSSQPHCVTSPQLAHNLIFFPKSWKRKACAGNAWLKQWHCTGKAAPRNWGGGERNGASAGGECRPTATDALPSICYLNTCSALPVKKSSDSLSVRKNEIHLSTLLPVRITHVI